MPRAREGCGSTSKAAPSPKPPRAHPYDLGTAAAEAISAAMEALGHKRVDTCAQRVTVDLDPFVLWRAPSHEELLDEHGELMRAATCPSPANRWK